MNKKVISVILVLCILCTFLSSCSRNTISGSDINVIIKSIREKGMTSVWEILALYYAGEDPSEFKGFDDVIKKTVSDDPVYMAEYVLISNVCFLLLTDPNMYEKNAEYCESLRLIVEAADGSVPISAYAKAFIALYGSEKYYASNKIAEYIYKVQKTDGGFADSGDKGDIPTTAIVISMMDLLRDNGISVNEPYEKAIRFVRGSRTTDNTYLESGIPTLNAAFSAHTAYITYHKKSGTDDLNDSIKSVMMFEKKGEVAFSNEIDGSSDNVAAAKALISTLENKNGMSIWRKLIDDIRKKRV